MIDTFQMSWADDPETAARYLHHIGLAQGMGALVDDMLDLSRLDTGETVLTSGGRE